MKITIKCPNCYQDILKDDSFCIFCGYDLTSTMANPISKDSAYDNTEESDISSKPYSGPCYCPAGHDVPDPSLGFCPVCGSPLIDTPPVDVEETPTDEYIPEDEPEYDSGHRTVIRRCTCGYECDDPDLNFCPACGLPFDLHDSSEFPVKPSDHKTGSGEKKTSIPQGMRPPEDKDLYIKKGL